MTAGLERRYRRLLWAYPGAYRRGHGTEIVTTLLDMAAAGHGRPSVAQRLHLVLCGLRQRFRLPARRPLAWVAAVFAAVALGAFGATGGTWLGWQTGEPVPSDRELRTLNAAMTGLPGDAAVYHQVSAMKGPSTFVRADGTGTYSAERIRAALSAAGWRFTAFTERQGATILDPAAGVPGDRVPTAFVTFTADKGGLKLWGFSSVITGGADHGLAGQAGYATSVWPREPAAVRPLTIAGLIAGALAGWLLAAALAYRVRGGTRPRRQAATVLSTAALAAAAVPGYELYRDAYQVMVYANGSPQPYIVDDPGAATPILTYTVVGLLAAVAALVAARPRRQPATG